MTRRKSRRLRAKTMRRIAAGMKKFAPLPRPRWKTVGKLFPTRIKFYPMRRGQKIIWVTIPESDNA